ncbi:13329_t:CDS:2, partial [Gigaspora rosea]
FEEVKKDTPTNIRKNKEALNSNISKNTISKRKRDPDLSQKVTKKQASTLTESTSRYNNIYDKKDTLRGSQLDKTNISLSSQRKMRVEKQGFSTSTREKRP